MTKVRQAEVRGFVLALSLMDTWVHFAPTELRSVFADADISLREMRESGCTDADCERFGPMLASRGRRPRVKGPKKSPKKSPKKTKPRCIRCDTEIRDASPIEPFSRIYNRECPACDGDLCERAPTPKERARG